jgi:hypothetical protein
MAGNALAKLRSFLVRGLAVAAVLLTWAVGTVGTQIAGALGVSSLMLATTATPAEAYRRRVRRRRYVPRRRFRRRAVVVVPRRRFRRRRVIRRRGWGW